jgi:type I restriction enzyme S subunit
LDDNEVAFGSTEFIVMRKKEKITDDMFVYYLAISPDFRNKAIQSMTGTSGRQRVQQDVLQSHKIMLPPLHEQKAIAATLSALDDMIELNNQINKTLEEMAQAIFKSWFVDFEPFKDGEFEESELGLIPKGWKVGTFGEVAEITSGKRPVSKQDKETPDFYVPLVGASCIMGYVNETLYNEPIIVIGRVGTHGIVQRFNTQCWPSDNTLVIKSNHYEFAYQILKGIDYRAFNRGSTQPLITQTDIKNYKIVIPDSYYLSRFEDTVKTLYKQYTVNNSESRLLERIRDMILPKLINGEIRVPVEEVV